MCRWSSESAQRGGLTRSSESAQRWLDQEQRECTERWLDQEPRECTERLANVEWVVVTAALEGTWTAIGSDLYRCNYIVLGFITSGWGEVIHSLFGLGGDNPCLWSSMFYKLDLYDTKRCLIIFTSWSDSVCTCTTRVEEQELSSEVEVDPSLTKTTERGEIPTLK